MLFFSDIFNLFNKTVTAGGTAPTTVTNIGIAGNKAEQPTGPGHL